MATAALCAYQAFGCAFIGQTDEVYKHMESCPYGTIYELSKQVETLQTTLAFKDASIAHLKQLHAAKDTLIQSLGATVPPELTQLDIESADFDIVYEEPPPYVEEAQGQSQQPSQPQQPVPTIRSRIRERPGPTPTPAPTPAPAPATQPATPAATQAPTPAVQQPSVRGRSPSQPLSQPQPAAPSTQPQSSSQPAQVQPPTPAPTQPQPQPQPPQPQPPQPQPPQPQQQPQQQQQQQSPAKPPARPERSKTPKQAKEAQQAPSSPRGGTSNAPPASATNQDYLPFTPSAAQHFLQRGNAMSASSPNLSTRPGAISNHSGKSTSTQTLLKSSSASGSALSASGSSSSSGSGSSGSHTDNVVSQLQPNANGNYVISNNTGSQTVFEDSWYFGDINRVEAELILSSCGYDTLLVRTSSIPGCHALSKYSLYNNLFTHLLITTVPGGLFIENCLDKSIYPNINQLLANSPECTGFIPAGIIYRSSSRQEESQEPEQTEVEITEDAKRERLRNRVLDELITTEKDYSNDLGLLVKYYSIPLEKKDSKLLPKEEVSKLFSNLSELLDIGYQVLNTLEQRKRRKDADGRYEVGDAFTKMADSFKAYTVYCINHPTAVATIERCRQKYPEFAAFEKKVQSMPETKGIGLPGYLIKPIQRLCKYPLLLKEILKHTPENHPEYANLRTAVAKINQVVEYVNERKKLAENENKLNEIKARLEGLEGFELVKNTRYFVLETPAKKVIKKEEKADYKLYIFSDMLLYAKRGKKDKYKYKGRLPLDLLRCIDVFDAENITNAIEILSQSLTSPTDDVKLTFYLPSDKEKKKFIHELKRSTKEYFVQHQDQILAEAEARKYLAEFQFKEVVDPVQQLKERKGLTKRTDSQKKFQTSFAALPHTPPKEKAADDPKTSVFRMNSSDRIKAVARYDNFAATEMDLEFSKGDTVWVLAQNDSGWWKGECNGLVGCFRQDLVEISGMVAGDGNSSPSSGSPSSSPSSASPISSASSTPVKQRRQPVGGSNSFLNMQEQKQLVESSSQSEPPKPLQKIPSGATLPGLPLSPQSLPSPSPNRLPPPPPLSLPPHAAPSASSPSTSPVTYPYAVLSNAAQRPKDLDSSCLEKYLTEAEFMAVFKMTRDAFSRLPPWKKESTKKSLNLF